MAGRLRLHIGWSNSLGWYEGFCLLVAVNPAGAITGLRWERPHDMSGLRARLAARVALHNCENVGDGDLRSV